VPIALGELGGLDVPSGLTPLVVNDEDRPGAWVACVAGAAIGEAGMDKTGVATPTVPTAACGHAVNGANVLQTSAAAHNKSKQILDTRRLFRRQFVRFMGGIF